MREVDGQRSSPTARRAMATTSAARDEFKIFTNINSTIVDPKNFDERQLRRLQRRRLHHPAQFVRAGAHRGVLPDPAERAHDLPRKMRDGDTRVLNATTGALVPIKEIEPGASVLAPRWLGEQDRGVSAFMPQGRKPGVRAPNARRHAHQGDRQPSVPYVRWLDTARAASRWFAHRGCRASRPYSEAPPCRIGKPRCWAS